jgi:hypothetical protein
MIYRMLVTLTLLAPAEPAQVPDKPSSADQVAILERFAGEWVVDGKWADGQPLHARGVYELGLGKKILHTKTFVKDGDKEYQRYESIMAWHPEKKCLYQVSFAFDGSINEVVIEMKDKDTLHVGWVPFTEGKPSKVRQVIRLLDNDRFQWTVSIHNGGEWQQLIDAVWKRKGK